MTHCSSLWLRLLEICRPHTRMMRRYLSFWSQSPDGDPGKGRQGDAQRRTFALRSISVLRFWNQRGFDSNMILILGVGIIMSIGSFSEMLSQCILVGKVLVGRLGIACPIAFSVGLVPDLALCRLRQFLPAGFPHLPRPNACPGGPCILALSETPPFRLPDARAAGVPRSLSSTRSR